MVRRIGTRFARIRAAPPAMCSMKGADWNAESC
jgi:hypothetical protein